jgi:integrase
VYKRKDRSLWQEDLVINGKRKSFYGRTKPEVLRKIAAYKEAEAHGRRFAEVADEWWAEHEGKIAYNTAKSYKPAKERACQEFGDRYIRDITPSEIYSYLLDFAKAYTEKTVKTQLMIFNLIGKYAVARGYISSSPARDLSAPKGLPSKKIHSPSSEDIERVKQSTRLPFGMFAYFAMYTGMRRGELLALDWSDISLSERTISINKSLYHVNNKPRVKKPKTATSIGKVPILDKLLEKLKPSKGLVFPNDEGKHMTEMQFQRTWERYCKASGVTATPHQFRHCYATMLVEAGIAPEKAQALLRHSQLSTTMDVYRDIREAELKKIFSEVYTVDIS